MLRDRSELENNLSKVIDDIKYRRKNIEAVNRALSEYDITAGFFTEITQKPELLKEIETPLLCLVSIAVFELTKSKNIDPEVYFTPREIEEAKKYKEEFAHEIELPV